MGFGGNLEPSFVIPTVVACHDSFAASAALAVPGANAVSPAQQQQQAHVAALMADLDVHVGEAAYAAARSGPYKLTHPVQRGQVGGKGCMWVERGAGGWRGMQVGGEEWVN
ncbi:unnamed protein product [Closterium sp. Yama58-4]|nr:unnamed protein product [Closterium sp. Yama58-4]